MQDGPARSDGVGEWRRLDLQQLPGGNRRLSGAVLLEARGRDRLPALLVFRNEPGAVLEFDDARSADADERDVRE